MSKSGYNPITNIYKKLNTEELKSCHKEVEALQLKLNKDPDNKTLLDTFIDTCIRFGDLELNNKEPNEAKIFYEKAKGFTPKNHFKFSYLNTKLLEAIEECILSESKAKPKK